GISPATLASLGIAASPVAPPPDPRLGYESSRPRRRAPLPAAPAAAPEAEQQLLALAATSPFVTFAETVLEWQRRAGPELGAALAGAAAPLAVRELLAALDRGERPFEAVLLLARLIPAGGQDERV